jgi:hypothetical protein
MWARVDVLSARSTQVATNHVKGINGQEYRRLLIAIGQHLRQCDCGPLMLGGPVSGGFSTKTLLRKSQAASLLPNALIAYSLIPHVRLMQTSRGVA